LLARFWYAGPVFRQAPKGGVDLNEVFQVGFEHIGNGSNSAIELLSLLDEILQTILIGLDFKVLLGQASFFLRFCEIHDIHGSDKIELAHILDAKDIPLLRIYKLKFPDLDKNFALIERSLLLFGDLEASYSVIQDFMQLYKLDQQMQILWQQYL